MIVNFCGGGIEKSEVEEMISQAQFESSQQLINLNNVSLAERQAIYTAGGENFVFSFTYRGHTYYSKEYRSIWGGTVYFDIMSVPKSGAVGRYFDMELSFHLIPDTSEDPQYDEVETWWRECTYNIQNMAPSQVKTSIYDRFGGISNIMVPATICSWYSGFMLYFTFARKVPATNALEFYGQRMDIQSDGTIQVFMYTLTIQSDGSHTITNNSKYIDYHD